MTYLLIIFVIAVALAPLSHFAPSKRQREIARMREYAAVHGMFVEFRSLPARGGVVAGSATRARDSAGRETIYYGKRLPPPKHRRAKALAWLAENEGWRGLDRGGQVPAALALLPASVLAASLDEGSCGVYWRESGGVEEVEKIRQALEVLSAELAERESLI